MLVSVRSAKLSRNETFYLLYVPPFFDYLERLVLLCAKRYPCRFVEVIQAEVMSAFPFQLKD